MKYDIFISYRGTRAINADLVLKHLITTDFKKSQVFLDRHEGRPGPFPGRLRAAVKDSECLLLLVTHGCFEEKKEGDDWFVEEIKSAIAERKTIIPLLFDDIKQIDSTILNATICPGLTPEEIQYLESQQSIQYSTEYPEESLKKLNSFLLKVLNRKEKTSGRRDFGNFAGKGWLKLIGFAIPAFLAVYIVFCAIGFAVTYLGNIPDENTFYTELNGKGNTHLEGNLLVYSSEEWGVTASYNPETDDVSVTRLDLDANKLTATDFWRAASISFAATSALNVIKGGGEQRSKLVAGVVTFVGVLFGYNEGANIGRLALVARYQNSLVNYLEDSDNWKNLKTKYLRHYK